LKTLLIAPPQWIREKKLLGELCLTTVPLGLSYIAAVLESNGFSSEIMDMNFHEIGMERVEEKLAYDKPGIVGITSMTSNFQNALAVVKAVKLQSPGSNVVMGGVHATFMHKEILTTIPEVDIVVRYEGEFTMSELADALENGRSLRGVKGISFREGGSVVSTPLRERIEDLDSLPYPAHHLLKPSVEDYIKNFGKRSFPVMTTRGCPFGCIFCSTMAFHGRKYRTRSILNVMAELEYLVEKFKADNISFIDDNFTMQNERVFAICEEIKKRKLPIDWGCSARVDQVSEKLLKTMKEAGCNDLFLGIESVSQRVLNLVKKGYSVKQAKDAVRTAEKLGIRTHCSFIIGLPGESARSLRSIEKFIEETKPSGRVLPNLLVTFPGTELLERKSEYFSNQPTVSMADMTRTQLGMMTKFYKINYGVEKLFRVEPPNIVIE
jgi:radical SAM superfamily enzyme YgiQ (UPF0313 family)